MLETYHKYNEKKKHPTEEWLFIFDDCTNDKAFKRSKMMERILKNGRSRFLTVWTLSQRFTDLHPETRLQYIYYCFFNDTQDLQKQAIYRVAGIGKQDDFINSIQEGFTDRHDRSFLFIHSKSRDKNNKLWFNFEEEPYIINRTK